MSLNYAFGLRSLEYNEQESLNLLFECFGNKPFLRHHAQGFAQALVNIAYNKEKLSFYKTVNDRTFTLKAWITPHGNEESLKNDQRTDFCMCPPTGIRIILSIATLKAWKLYKADVKLAFVQNWSAQREVYVILSRKRLSKHTRR